ncbi:hypothetical protein Tco_1272842 [Tanacetum coccineum]
MCDKKNSVLFIDTECVVLSPDFKLPDESYVLLKVPRKDNMYSVDLKNVVPRGEARRGEGIDRGDHIIYSLVGAREGGAADKAAPQLGSTPPSPRLCKSCGNTTAINGLIRFDLELYCVATVFSNACIGQPNHRVVNPKTPHDYLGPQPMTTIVNVVIALRGACRLKSDPGSCGNGAHIGYNCPPKALIISNSEQCNQTIAELPQTLPSVHPTCNYEDENSFIYDSKLNSSNDSPSVLTHPPQLQFETYLCEICGNNAHYGYDCPL